MVAPYDIGDPIRSFVRVTGTGTKDKQTESICLDLALGSTAAGTVSVPQILPPATPIHELLKINQHNEPRDSGQLKRKCNVDNTIEPPSKSGRIIMMDGPENPGSKTDPMGGNTVKRVLLTENISTVSPVIKQIMIKILEEITCLRKENGDLRKKNEQLEERVALFHDFFKNHSKILSKVLNIKTT